MSRLLTLCLTLLFAAPSGAAEDWPAALAQAERALSADPADHAARFAKGVALSKLGQRGAAITEFEALTRVEPGAPEPWNNLAVLYAERGDLQAARDALERALATDAKYQTAHKNLAAVYAALAGEAYRKALVLDASKPAPTRLAVLETMTVATPPVEMRTVPTLEVTVTQSEPAAVATATPPAVEQARPVAAVAPDAPAEVRAAVEAWAQAWRSKEVAAYLAAYTPDYAPAGQDHATWVAQRSVRVRAPKRIELKLINLAVEMDTKDRAHARFVQDYQSDTFSGATRKTLELVRQDGRWLISAERTGAR